MADAPSFRVSPPREDLNNPVLEFYFDYWHQQRRGRGMPSRADIYAKDVKPYLGYLILLDAPGDRDSFRYRLVGTRVTDYFLGDATGATIREAYAAADMPKPYVDAVVQIHRTVCEWKKTMLLRAGHGEWKGVLYPPFEALYFPLSDNDCDVNMVMTIFSFDKEALKLMRNRSPVVTGAASAA